MSSQQSKAATFAKSTSFLGLVQETCRLVGNKKSDQPIIMLSATEELGELAQEVKIGAGLRAKPAGKDGIVGEAMDTILCCLDIIHSEIGHLDDAFLKQQATPKLMKWQNKAIKKLGAHK